MEALKSTMFSIDNVDIGHVSSERRYGESQLKPDSVSSLKPFLSDRNDRVPICLSFVEVLATWFYWKLVPAFRVLDGVGSRDGAGQERTQEAGCGSSLNDSATMVLHLALLYCSAPECPSAGFLHSG